MSRNRIGDRVVADDGEGDENGRPTSTYPFHAIYQVLGVLIVVVEDGLPLDIANETSGPTFRLFRVSNEGHLRILPRRQVLRLSLSRLVIGRGDYSLFNVFRLFIRSLERLAFYLFVRVEHGYVLAVGRLMFNVHQFRVFRQDVLQRREERHFFMLVHGLYAQALVDDMVLVGRRDECMVHSHSLLYRVRIDLRVLGVLERANVYDGLLVNQV